MTATVPRKPRSARRLAARLLALGLLAAGGMAGAAWWHGQTGARPLPTPVLDAERTRGVLSLLSPGYPQALPWLETRTGAVRATEGRLDAMAAVTEAGTGRELWGVAYTWLGPADGSGARAALPGFAVVEAPLPGQFGRVRYVSPGTGGWERGGNGVYDGTVEVASRVEAVPWSEREAGFLVHHTVETALGGRMGRGLARAFLAGLGGWELAWEHEVQARLRPDRALEVSREAVVEAVDLEGTGERVIVATPNWYIRQLGADDRGVHFTADGPGRMVFRRDGSQFVQTHFLPFDGAGAPSRVRPHPPLYAVRAARAPAIDGAFEDWEVTEASHLGTIWLDEMAQLRYQSRARRGSHDFSGAIRLMWDPEALYVRAEVMDDKLRGGREGSQLYLGDHLGLWLDVDLARDFTRRRRDHDDWQLGLAPRVTPEGRVAGATAWAWVPQAGARGIRAAATPLVDPYDQAERGWQVEAAIPWRALGQPPPLRAGAGQPPVDPRLHLQARRYQLRPAGILGLALILTDADEKPQEMAYVSSPELGWGEPATFNPLLLVEAVARP